MRAFAADGAEIGLLKAQGAWGEILHDLKLRQEVLKLRGRKRLGGAISQEFLERYVASKLTRAKRSRRAASDAARTIRALSAEPRRVSTQAMHPSLPAPDVPSSAAAVPAPEARPEPERLRIGSGFVGHI